jgi:hypothetical protein
LEQNTFSHDVQSSALEMFSASDIPAIDITVKNAITQKYFIAPPVHFSLL